MGIQNKDGALYFATGIDNSGLYSGRQEAMGIIKAMASEITVFDVFGGIGISAGIAFARAAKGAYDFEKQFQQSMKEVATLSNGIKGSLTDYMNQVMEITRTIPVEANEAAKALYQIVSAGHDGANGMKVLEASAKAAVGGVTDTATAADAITTVLNAYKLDASKAQEVSDQLFTTVRLGKTDFGQLGKSIAQAAPIAASFGIDIKEVLGAVASITKQGVPTSEAMTKIRAAILGTANQLGDAAFKGRTFQEALQLIYDKAGGSSTKMKELLGTDEALQAALMLTGEKAKEAASDLDEVNNSAGAAEAAFKEMASSAENQMKLLGNNITATLRPLGKEILKQISSAAQSINKAFDNGNAQESLKTIGALIVTVTTALAGYKGSILAISTAKQVHATVTAIVNKQRTIEAANLVLTKGMYAVEAAMIAKNTSARVLLTKALKAQTIAQLKNAAAMLTNPYVLAAAAFATLGYAIYHVVTVETEAEKVQRKYNEACKAYTEQADNLKKSATDLLSTIRDETSANYEKVIAYNKLQSIMPNIFKNMDIEKLKLMDILSLNKMIAEEVQRRARIGAQTKLIMAQRNYNSIQSLIAEDSKRGTYSGQYDIQLGRAKIEVDAAQKVVDNIAKIQKQAKEEDKKENKKAKIQNKAFWTKQKDDATKALDSIASAQKKLMDAGNFKGIDATVVTAYKENIKKLKEAEKELKVYDSFSKQDDKAQKLHEEQEKYAILLDKQKLESQRQTEDLENQIAQSRIDAMVSGESKVRAQRELDNQKEIQVLKRQKEDYIRAVIRAEKDKYDAQEELNAKKDKSYRKKTFNPSIVKVNTIKFNELISNELIQQAIAPYKEEMQAWNEYLVEYGNFQQKKSAINAEYNQKIAEATTKGEKESLKKERDSKLKEVTFDELKKTINFADIFGDLNTQSTETLTKMRNKLKEIINKSAKDLKPTDLKELQEAFSNIDLKIAERNPFGELKQGIEGYKNATEAVIKAQEDLNTIQEGGEVVVGTYTDETGKLITKLLTQEQAERNLSDAQKGRLESQGKLTKAVNSIGQQGQQLVNAGNNLVDMLTNLGVEVPESISGALSGLGQIMNGLESIDLTKPFSIISSTTGILAGITKTISSFFGGPDGTAYYEGVKEQLEAINKVYDRIIDKSKEGIVFGGGFASVKSAIQALDNYEKKVINLQKIATASGRAGASWKSHSAEWHSNKNVGAVGGFEQMSDILGKSISSMTDLYSLSGDELFIIQSRMPEAWSLIDARIRENLDSIVACKDEANELRDALNQAMTGVDIDSFYNGFIDQLSDMDTSFEDMCDNFEGYLRKSIMAGLVASQYQDRINALYGQWSDAAQSDKEITEEEANALKNQYQQIVKDMMHNREEMAKSFGWDSDEDSKREVSKKGIATASQDSVTENNGRLAVVQEHTYSINEGVKQIYSNTGKIVEKLAYLSNMDKNMNEMMRNGDLIITYLSDISSHTARLEAIEKSIESIRMGIDTLNTKGITLKR
ncbi:phage tail tape measure protein [Bacteroides caccae]|jgi:TP901 family phage tail tape measure protein|uniref:phage tail tape measure protein n=1 Tax=Bacteroides caccae TaxID=47678 RepID=UPI00237BCA84|nr:phage tail tape measure protein [Bacteroides caccae]